MRGGLSVIEYVSDRMLLDDGCWPWVGPISKMTGYGCSKRPQGGMTTAHRVVYELFYGQIPAGMVLDHRCHNEDVSCNEGPDCPHRRCVNPTHLEVVTRGENSRRGRGSPARNLAKTECPYGHPYDRIDSRGWRKCDTCMRASKTAQRRAAGARPTSAGAEECQRGHRFTPENTRWIHDGRHRACKQCQADGQRRRRAQAKARVA